MLSHKHKVLIADEFRLVAELCQVLLAAEFDVVGIANNGGELTRLALDLKPDVVVVDISLSILNRFDARGRLKEKLPNVKLVYLAMDSSEETAAEAMLLGTSGYVVKTCAASELIFAVRSVLRGKSFMCSAISKEKVNSLIWERKPGTIHRQELTPRQCDVLQLIAEGRQTKEVGIILGMRARTVAFHKYNARDALGLKTTTELIQYAIKTNMVNGTIRC